jgi:hypothetical protein
MGIQALAHVSDERLQENARPRESKVEGRLVNKTHNVHVTLEYFGLVAF